MADDNILQAEIDRLTEANAALEEKLRTANSNYYKAVSEREAAKKDRREEVADALTREQHWKRVATEAMEVSAARESLMNSGHWDTAVSNLKTALEQSRTECERLRGLLDKAITLRDRNWTAYERTREVLAKVLASVGETQQAYYEATSLVKEGGR